MDTSAVYSTDQCVDLHRRVLKKLDEDAVDPYEDAGWARQTFLNKADRLAGKFTDKSLMSWKKFYDNQKIVLNASNNKDQVGLEKKKKMKQMISLSKFKEQREISKSRGAQFSAQNR